MTETVSLKALARRVLERDSGRDEQRDGLSRRVLASAEAARQSAPVLENEALRGAASAQAEIENCEPSPDTWADTEEERAAIIEHEGGAPRAWAEALARLDPSKPPADVPPQRWLRFIDDCGRFLDGGWADKAAAFHWGPLDLFGCDRERPFARIDRLGLLWLLNGGKLVELHRNRAVLETVAGARQTSRRRPVEVGRTVLAWELAR